jgi:hypothetical protein
VKIIIFLTVLSAVVASTAAEAAAQSNKTFSVSVPHVEMANGERVVSFEISVTAGTVQAVSNLPIGWYVVVDNDASWRTTIKGNTTVGAASLTAEQFQNLWLVVKKDETYSKFSVSGKASVTKDFKKERLLVLKTGGFAVTATE